MWLFLSNLLNIWICSAWGLHTPTDAIKMAVGILFAVVSGSSIPVHGVLLRLAFDGNPSAVNISFSPFLFSLSFPSSFSFLKAKAGWLSQFLSQLVPSNLLLAHTCLLTVFPQLFYGSAALFGHSLLFCIFFVNQWAQIVQFFHTRPISSIAFEQPRDVNIYVK